MPPSSPAADRLLHQVITDHRRGRRAEQVDREALERIGMGKRVQKRLLPQVEGVAHEAHGDEWRGIEDAGYQSSSFGDAYEKQRDAEVQNRETRDVVPQPVRLLVRGGGTDG